MDARQKSQLAGIGSALRACPRPDAFVSWVTSGTVPVKSWPAEPGLSLFWIGSSTRNSLATMLGITQLEFDSLFTKTPYDSGSLVVNAQNIATKIDAFLLTKP